MTPPSLHLYVHPSSGYTSLVGSALECLTGPFLSSGPDMPIRRHVEMHVTFLTKHEAAGLRAAGVSNPFPSASPSFTEEDIVALGLGRSTFPNGTEATFLVLLIPRAQKLRLAANLSSRDFHISLHHAAGQSPKLFPHGIETLVESLRVELTDDRRTLRALSAEHWLRGEGEKSFRAAERLDAVSLAPSREEDGLSLAQDWIRLAGVAAKTQRWKVAMLAYGRAIEIISSSMLEEQAEKVEQHALRRLVRCGDFTEWGTTFFTFEAPELDDLSFSVRAELLQPWSEDVKEKVRREVEEAVMERGWTPVLGVEGRERALIVQADEKEEVQLMRNFRRILPFSLAVSSLPRSAHDISLLSSPPLDIRHIVTLSAESPLPASYFSLNPHVRHTFLPIPDKRAPTVEQMQLFLGLTYRSIVERDEPILVHCGAGKGRAGTMTAAYLVAFGFCRPPADLDHLWSYPAYAPTQAVGLLRFIRPESVETGEQESSLKLFHSRIVRDGRPFPLPPSIEPKAGLEVEGSLDGADLVVLVGLPGSGKSTFRRALLARDPAWRAISGDEDGKSSSVLAAISSFRGAKGGDKLVVDRCNVSPSSRRELLKLAHRASHPVCIFFDTPAPLCLYRAQNRSDHPTLPPGPRVRAALKQFERELVAPSLAEGWSAIVSATGAEAAREVVTRLAAGGGSGLLKFPRTAHLFDLGAATADDLVSASVLPSDSSKPPSPLFPALLSNSSLSLVLTEMLDGANLAFSLSPSPPHDLLVQNRSHYLAIKPGESWKREGGEHEQFRKLGQWMGEREEELRRLLGVGEEMPERYIIYGEWMAVTHSIHYTSLPSLVHAFDLYDRRTHSFLSRRLLAARLRHLAPSIPLVPLLYAGSGADYQTRGALEGLLQGRSAYMAEETDENEARREGIYSKIENGEKVVERSKIVRGDFIAGDEHWSKGKIRLNELCRPVENVI
ncbi:hypothetical protein JCM11251_000513 [Rhodosporidiobolus azoricus]